MDKFKLSKRLVIKDIPIFNKFSMQFYFKANKPGVKDGPWLIFAKQE